MYFNNLFDEIFLVRIYLILSILIETVEVTDEIHIVHSVGDKIQS